MSRHVHVLARQEDLEPRYLPGRTVVVIDVLLATTTLVTALERGAKEVHLAADREDAERVGRELGAGGYLRAGEYRGHALAATDLGPFPSHFTPQAITGQRIVFTTTNGTRAAHRCRGAKQLVLAALVNGPAVAKYLLGLGGERVIIVCSGNLGRVAVEDLFAAGLLVDELSRQSRVTMNDEALAARGLYAAHRADGEALLSVSRAGRFLMEYGFAQDVKLAAHIGSSAIVPQASGEFASHPAFGL